MTTDERLEDRIKAVLANKNGYQLLLYEEATDRSYTLSAEFTNDDFEVAGLKDFGQEVCRLIRDFGLDYDWILEITNRRFADNTRRSIEILVKQD